MKSVSESDHVVLGLHGHWTADIVGGELKADFDCGF